MKGIRSRRPRDQIRLTHVNRGDPRDQFLYGLYDIILVREFCGDDGGRGQGGAVAASLITDWWHPSGLAGLQTTLSAAVSLLIDPSRALRRPPAAAEGKEERRSPRQIGKGASFAPTPPTPTENVCV